MDISPEERHFALAQLKSWVKEKYTGREIRISGGPYFRHLTEVAELAGQVTALGYEIGLCHDLLEDTGMLPEELQGALIHFGYPDALAGEIIRTVTELTDFYTIAAFPDLSKRERKLREAQRLTTISAVAQTVKYADLIYNANWIVCYQPAKAAKYLRKKKKLLKAMSLGDPGLRRRAMKTINAGIKLFP